MNQIVQISGSLLVLASFTLSQAGLIDTRSLLYLAANAVGSAILSANALVGHQWGFLLLESAWAAVSLTGMLHVARRKALPSPQIRNLVVKRR